MRTLIHMTKSKKPFLASAHFEKVFFELQNNSKKNSAFHIKIGLITKNCTILLNKKEGSHLTIRKLRIDLKSSNQDTSNSVLTF